MPKKVYNNVEDHKLLDNSRVVEDVTSVTLPTISHPTSTIKSAGMVGDVDMPNQNHVDAMTFSISHNNGVNGEKLQDPGKHSLEFRLVRQRYNVQKAEIEHESVKYRITGIHKQTNKGSVETGNPVGSTEDYSVLRYEELVDGKQTVLLDVASGIIKYNGKEYSKDIQKLL